MSVTWEQSGTRAQCLVTETVRTTGLDAALAQKLGPWRKPLATHDPGKVLLDFAITLVLGGDCLADIAVLRSEPGLLRPSSRDVVELRVQLGQLPCTRDLHGTARWPALARRPQG